MLKEFLGLMKFAWDVLLENKIPPFTREALLKLNSMVADDNNYLIEIRNKRIGVYLEVNSNAESVDYCIQGSGTNLLDVLNEMERVQNAKKTA